MVVAAPRCWVSSRNRAAGSLLPTLLRASAALCDPSVSGFQLLGGCTLICGPSWFLPMPQLFSMTPLGLQNQYHVGAKSSCQWEAQPWPPGTQLLCVDPGQTLPRRFHPNNALFLITASFSAPLTIINCSSKAKFDCCGSGLLLITAYSVTPADQNRRII